MAGKTNDNSIESTLLKKVGDDFNEGVTEEFVYEDSGESLQDILDAQDVTVVEDDADQLAAQLELAREAPPVSKEGGRQRTWLIFTASMFGLAILSSFLLVPIFSIESQRGTQSTEIIGSVDVINSASEQALADADSFQQVKSSLRTANSLIDLMVSKDSMTKALSSGVFGHNLSDARLNSTWQSYEESVNAFLSNEESVAEVSGMLNTLEGGIDKATVDSVAFVDAVTREGQTRGSSAAKNQYLALSKEAADMTGMLSQLNSLNEDFLRENQDLAEISNEQNVLVLRLQDTLAKIQDQAASAVQTVAEPLAAQFDTLASQVQSIGGAAESLSAAKNSLADMQGYGQAVVTHLGAGTGTSGSGLSALSTVLPIVFALLGGLGLLRYSQAQTSSILERDEGLSRTVASQQDSILKLLDEMSSLADGDLTIEAEVTDQITGAIADSVNFAVIEMRQLVAQINSASEEVAGESETAVESANQVSQSNRDQAEKISSAALRMTEVANNIRSMSERAVSSSQLAQESMKAAEQGTEAVRDTIRGMEDMRTQIQDTSKRIKRLGESSQRIGDIVALIDDIAEQTNILSLNAAIQASMAGEAGRGFAVVSDEVQNLAERSTEATKRIADLVNTIQNDTNDAVQSMEKATEQVVAGTKVADTAGAALTEIETVSRRLSGLIEQISSDSNAQATTVTQVSDQVTEVSTSSSQTSEKAQESADSISKLLELSRELETSVSRFKLPAEVASA
ncbi:MAG: methyl-accepting chemotaxis protein [Pseudomonadota bacterium]